MIKAIELNNFQSHKYSRLELHEGINVLTGPTDNGKTVIVRAWDWVANNQPGGESFRSNWGGITSVALIDEDTCITRIKDKGKNLYIMGFGGLEEEYKSFGQGVPEEIAESLNMLPINMQFQMDPPFMLSQTPGEVARYLNEIVNLNDIDISAANLNKMSRENNQKLSSLGSQLSDQKESLKKYKWIRFTDIKLKKAEKQEQEIKESKGRKDRLDSLLEEISQTKERLRQLPNIKLTKKKIACLDKLTNEISILEGKRNNIANLISNVKQTNNKIESISIELSKLNKKLEEEFPNICPLCRQEVKNAHDL